MPITPTGYSPRSLAEIVEATHAELRAKISTTLDLSERSVLGNVEQIIDQRLADLEELLAVAYAGFDPDSADDDQLVALALLTGVPRNSATTGLVTATVNLAASKTFAAGDLAAHVSGDPTNRWLNRDVVTSTTAGNYSAVFESEFASSAAVAPAGTLTVIATPVAGWNTITNAADATEGTDIEAIEALRLRREQALAPGGARTRNAIRSQLIAVDGVLSAEVFENVTSSVDSNGIPPHAIHAVVWDGSPAAADSDDIAQAIWDFKAEGILAHGTTTGTAQDEVLGPVTVAFSRATPIAATVVVSIESESGVTIADVKAAILAVWPGAGIGQVGEPIVYNRIAAAVFRVPGIDDWATLTVSGGVIDLPGLQSVVRTLDESDISVSGDVE